MVSTIMAWVIIPFVPGILTCLLLQRRGFQTRHLKYAGLLLLIQVLLSLLFIFWQAQPDPPDRDQYFGVFALMLSAPIFLACYIALLLRARKQP